MTRLVEHSSYVYVLVTAAPLASSPMASANTMMHSTHTCSSNSISQQLLTTF